MKTFYYFAIILIFSCTKNTGNKNTCIKDSDCSIKNTCFIYSCTGGLCKGTKKDDGLSCGENLVCQNGSCISKEKCKTNEDCDDNNFCTNETCIDSNCVYLNADNETKCGNGMFCKNGSCICETNEDCEDNNPCTTNICSMQACTFEKLPNTSVPCDDNMICMYGNCVPEPVPTCTFDFQCNNGSACTKDYCSNSTCIHLDIASSWLKLCDNGSILGEYTCSNKDDCPENTVDTCKRQKAGCSENKCVYSSYWAFDGRECRDDMICSDGLCIDKIPCTVGTEGDQYCTNLVSDACKKNDWLAAKCSSFSSSPGFCTFNNVRHNTPCTIGEDDLGICNHGICNPIIECNYATDCDDNNPCTENNCINNSCNYEAYYPNGTDCSINSSQRYCSNGICILGNCSSDTDCPADTSCRDNFCNLNNFMCSWTAIQEEQYCSFPEPPVGTPPNSLIYQNYLLSIQYNIFSCNTGTCSFNPINIGLCDTPFVNTGTIHALYIHHLARELNNEQVVLAVAGKFNDSGLHKCAGYYVNFIGSGTVFPIFGDDYPTPEKEGFSYAEPINLYIRTNNYVCQVKANYDTTTGYTSTDKWYPFGMSKIVKFKDMSDVANIDFTNTTYCTPIN